MTRYMHRNVEPILRYLEAEQCPVLLMDWEREPVVGGFAMLPSTLRRRAANPPKPVGHAEVAFIAGHGSGPTHAATVLKYYFHVRPTTLGRPLSLAEAVEHVEVAGAANEFLLAGHPNGGLISVSREPLPFEQGVEPITWWGR